MNALCALGLAMTDDVDNKDRTAELIHAMAALQGAPGRLQLVPGTPDGAAIYVDYAHTPDALANILEALRPHTAGRLLCLFGCGGDRDPGKRPIMGQIAARDADVVIVTDDNPRSEDPAKIRAAVMRGAGGKAQEIGGRREAIRKAVGELRHGDVLVLAGKGHERGQIFADHVEPFDDFEEAVNAIEGLKGAA
jgi:UDP-N-acetylmuramyl-tripeptide synthetase